MLTTTDRMQVFFVFITVVIRLIILVIILIILLAPGRINTSNTDFGCRKQKMGHCYALLLFRIFSIAVLDC